ncbi:MAG: pyridoxamine 5'-phosphate oxidase family protein [Candidatus Eremiobacteraeota bacterium]|nr:pyridoxamine 5'-phosphate oxidase family protein [Candidatus Eremiobacteraeota bacterium]
MTQPRPGLYARARRLLDGTGWLGLATVDEGGTPSASYVPFALVGGRFGIVVSRLAAHTEHLKARRPASALFVDEESRSEEVDRDPYARSRLSVAIQASLQPAGSAEAAAIWSALERRHGVTVAVLRELPDFDAVALAPGGGRLVLGFASAHDLDAGEIERLLA